MYIVYRLTSPSNKFYIGYTSNTIYKRCKVHSQDRHRMIKQGKNLPRFYASWKKYPLDLWLIDILHTTSSKEEACMLEKTEIVNHKSTSCAHGYNMTNGGDGGDTGRNGELKKRLAHSSFMKNHHATNPEGASKAGVKNWETSRASGKYNDRCQQISNRTPRGINHWNHTGCWVVRHNKYATLREAVLHENINESTITQYCNDPDVLFKRHGKLGLKGQTRRYVGFYRIRKGENG